MYNGIHNGESPHATIMDVDLDEESSGGVWSGGKPSEKERASWEQQRQRREKLSSMMGQYLLKGYRMLGSNCSDCGTILLQTRDGVNYCVQCSELTRDSTDASPQQQQQEKASLLPTAVKFPTAADSSSSSTVQNALALSGDEDKTLSKPNFKDLGTHNPSQANAIMSSGIGSVEEALVLKLQWASTELVTASSVEESTQICLLIKACAEALKSVRELDSKPHASILKIQNDTNRC